MGTLVVKGLTHILAVKVARDNCKNSENRNLFSKFNFMLTKFVLNIFRLRFSFLATYFLISACCLVLNKKIEKDGKSWLKFALHCGYFLSYSKTNLEKFWFRFYGPKNASFLFFIFLLWRLSNHFFMKKPTIFITNIKSTHSSYIFTMIWHLETFGNET